MERDISNVVSRSSRAAKDERPESPKTIQRMTAKRYPMTPGIHKAYVRVEPVNTSPPTVECYLDRDVFGDQITVRCYIAGGMWLTEATPRLIDGNIIFVVKIDDEWWCVTTFQATEDCICETP